jgi:hypothetical protein
MNTLITTSPYVSTEVLNQAMLRTDIFSDSSLFNIMVKNPDALSYQPLVINLGIILEGSLADSVFAHLADTTSRTSLQDSVSLHGSNLDSLSRDLILYMTADTTGFDHGAYQAILAGMNNLAADYVRVDDYWTQGYADSAVALFDSLPVKYAIDTLSDSIFITSKALLQFKISARQDSLSISYLDSAHISDLNNIALTGKGPAARAAKGALNFFYGYPYITQLVIPSRPNGNYDALRIQTHANNITHATDTTGYLKVYPNPTNGLENFAFKLPCDDADGILVISDMTGHTMYSNVIGSDVNMITLDTRSWSNGSYLYKLSCSNKIVGTGKFEVIK